MLIDLMIIVGFSVLVKSNCCMAVRGFRARVAKERQRVQTEQTRQAQQVQIDQNTQDINDIKDRIQAIEDNSQELKTNNTIQTFIAGKDNFIGNILEILESLRENREHTLNYKISTEIILIGENYERK